MTDPTAPPHYPPPGPDPAPAQPRPPFPQPPPGPPAYPPPPATPAPGPGRTPSRLAPAVVIGAVVAVVALVGGAVAVLTAAQDHEERPQVIPAGLALLDPTTGPQPAEPVQPQPGPGPGSDPVVTTPPEPIPGDGPEPVAPPTDAVEIGDGVSVVPAAGWSVSDQDTGYVELEADSGDGMLYLSLLDEGVATSAAGAISSYFDVAVTPYVSEIQMAEIEPISGVGGTVIDAAQVLYEGVQAGQAGNLPVEGYIAVFVRQDGSVATYEEFNVAGTYDGLGEAYGAMLQSLVHTL
jgi:hypothetical protein